MHYVHYGIFVDVCDRLDLGQNIIMVELIGMEYLWVLLQKFIAMRATNTMVTTDLIVWMVEDGVKK